MTKMWGLCLDKVCAFHIYNQNYAKVNGIYPTVFYYHYYCFGDVVDSRNCSTLV